jgi:hypothetical protein
VLCHQFRRDADPQFFASSTPGPREQPKKAAARALIETRRKQNDSVYEISEILKRIFPYMAGRNTPATY